MKAKLSSFALPLNRGLALAFCLGLVITLVLAACSSDSPTKNKEPDPNNPGGTSSGSGGTVGVIDVDGFEVKNYYPDSKRVVIEGTFIATPDDPIVKVTYSISGGDSKLSWISYDRSPLTGPITVNEQRSFDLNDAVINLNNEEIKCGITYSINVTANTKSGKGTAYGNGTFEKPSGLCSVANSSAVEISSSSMASWKFGAPTEGQAWPRMSYNLSGSGSFKLLTDDESVQANQVDQPDIEITGGKIKGPVTPCVEGTGTSAGPSGNINKDSDGNYYSATYSSEKDCLGSTPATHSNLSQIEGGGLQGREYYLIYLNDGSAYLLFFTDGEGGSLTKYPLKYITWPATEKP